MEITHDAPHQRYQAGKVFLDIHEKLKLIKLKAEKSWLEIDNKSLTTKSDEVSLDAGKKMTLKGGKKLTLKSKKDTIFDSKTLTMNGKKINIG